MVCFFMFANRFNFRLQRRRQDAQICSTSDVSPYVALVKIQEENPAPHIS